ncbi:MAG: 3-hydroxyisobutyrate dehydrogenase [Pseudomonadales bacterium]
MATIAFIGLGNMGGPMAANLLNANHQLAVFDLVPAAMQVPVDAGACAAESAVMAVKGIDFVISMLPAGKHVESLYLGSGDDGLLSQLDSKAIIIDCSTIDAVTARKVATAAREKGIAMVDAPVSGGVAGAMAGTLTFICGGDQFTFEKAKPILENMGKNVFHAGGSGAGQVAKICNNMLLGVLMAGTSEALRLGVDNGLDPVVLSNIMLASSGRNWTLELYNPYPGVMENAPASNDYKPGFMVDLMCKDLGLAIETAEGSHSVIPMGGLARSLYLAHQQAGNGQMDFSSIIKSLDH